MKPGDALRVILACKSYYTRSTASIKDETVGMHALRTPFPFPLPTRALYEGRVEFHRYQD